MVERRRLSRLRIKAQRGGIVIELKDGSTEVFPKCASLEFTVACWEEGMAADKGEEYTWRPETKRLKKALENATPESYAEFKAKYAIIYGRQLLRDKLREGWSGAQKKGATS